MQYSAQDVLNILATSIRERSITRSISFVVIYGRFAIILSRSPISVRSTVHIVRHSKWLGSKETVETVQDSVLELRTTPRTLLDQSFLLESIHSETLDEQIKSILVSHQGCV